MAWTYPSILNMTKNPDPVQLPYIFLAIHTGQKRNIRGDDQKAADVSDWIVNPVRMKLRKNYPPKQTSGN